MKKWLFVSLLLTSTAFAVDRRGGQVQPVISTVGDTFKYSKVSVSSSTVSTLSAYSSSRAHLICYNSGAFELYIGSDTTVSSQGSASFEVSPSTGGFNSRFETYNLGEVDAIARAGTSGTTVYCEEER